MQLGVQQQKAKVFFWAPSDLSVGATVSTGTKQTSMQECKDADPSRDWGKSG